MVPLPDIPLSVGRLGVAHRSRRRLGDQRPMCGGLTAPDPGRCNIRGRVVLKKILIAAVALSVIGAFSGEERNPPMSRRMPPLA
jgi:hypothetical protein